MKSLKIKCLFAFLFVSLFVDAQEFDRFKMDSLFSIIQSYDQGMGSVSIFYDGCEVYRKSYGMSDIESKNKANAKTKYRIASISKVYTAAVIMKLIESEKLSLQTKLDFFYPQIKNADQITIEHLLNHKSGIFNHTASDDYFEWNTTKMSRKALLEKIATYESVFEPGSRFEYSNSNYLLLTFIAERVSGKTLGKLLEQYITKPCCLKNTTIGSSIKVKKNEARSYNKSENWELVLETDLSTSLGAGSMISTPTELNLFFTALAGAQIVTQKSLQLMLPRENGVGLGLFEVPFCDMKGYGHTGGMDGFESNVFYFPNQKVSVAILSNAVAYPLNDILIGMLSIYFDKEYQLPVFAQPIRQLENW